MEQSERFSVACLALVLQHVPKFRAEFLKHICEWDEPGSAAKFEVLVEIENCGDLALEAKSLGVVFVLECKINAPLQPNQRHDDQFILTGYGMGILARYPKSKYPLPTYITLQQDADKRIGNPREDKLRYLAKTWRDLLNIDAATKRIPLVKDLLGSLAARGVRCFAPFNMQTEKMNLIKKALDACRVEALLDNTAAAVTQVVPGLIKCKKSETLLTTDTDSYIGRGLECKNAKWLSLIGPNDYVKKAASTWFGYQGGKRQVGFHCAQGKVKNVNAALEKAAGKFGAVKKDEAEKYVWIESDGSQPDGDQEWFVKIYTRLKKHIEGARPA